MTEKRWFMMRVTPMQWHKEPRYIISHQNITERKLAEERVLDLSNTDELTGLANRRQYNFFLNQEWRRCTRSHQPLSLIMMDIDHFKLFNDKYGHLAGDECLRKVGKLLLSSISRVSDLAARYGGEEFTAVLSNCDRHQATMIAEKLLQAVQQLQIPHAYSQTAEVVTASIGVATISPGNYTDEHSLEAEADRMMYLSKSRGRNQVSVADMD
jgi:diguanylate cyclase (GGDEF)-like protein